MEENTFISPEDKTSLKELYHVLVSENNSKALPYLHVLGKLVEQASDAITLKSLLASDNWPQAIDSHLICEQDSEVDKISRAEGILELIIEKDLKDKKFLDFGCGEGHVSYKSLIQEPVISVGYDIEKFKSWDKFGTKNEKLLFTTDLSVVENQSPYDIILIYDVIDHMKKEKAIELLKTVKNLLDKDGTIYLRVHPFCSRHATHLYHKINKAFVHLVFNHQELIEMGYDSPDTAEIMYPIAQYTEIIKESGLYISHNNILREKVEPFFKKTPIIKERIRMNYKNSTDKNIKSGGFPEFQCEQQFLDFVIKKKERI